MKARAGCPAAARSEAMAAEQQEPLLLQLIPLDPQVRLLAPSELLLPHAVFRSKMTIFSFCPHDLVLTI